MEKKLRFSCAAAGDDRAFWSEFELRSGGRGSSVDIAIHRYELVEGKGYLQAGKFTRRCLVIHQPQPQTLTTDPDRGHIHPQYM
jgi:hypothetical protein